MGKTRKREIRRKFREAVFRRDGYRCVVCGRQAKVEEVDQVLDAHHIVPREDMPNGGYVKENGVTLCDPAKSGGDAETGCHFKAEMILKTWAAGTQYDPEPEDPYYPFAPEQLYKAIGSSWEQAVEAAKRLK